MSKYRRPWTHYAVLSFNIVIVVALIVVGIGFLWTGQRLGGRQVVSLNRDETATTVADAQVEPTEEWNLDAGDLEAKNFLITGSDSGGCVDPDSPYAGAFGDRSAFGERSDTIMIIRVNPKENQAAFLSFPRDLWVQIAGSTRSNRINTAFDRKNPNRLVDTIYQNFGIEVDHYVNIDFCAFKDIVDAVDGVKVPFSYSTRDKKTGLFIPNASCYQFSGDHALAYVRSRSGYSYFDEGKQSWVFDGTGDLGRISRQQDFIRRAMQRALDKGSGSPRVANDLLNVALKNVITDDDLTPIRMLQLAQAMRGLNTSGIPSYTIEASGQMIGDQSVLIPRLQNDTMRQILALFQGKASFGVPAGEQESETVESAPAFMGVAYVAAPANTETSPTTTIPVVAPEQDTIGFVPPNDPSCR
jgi:LCP family protein required for cell wall assembly